MSGQRISVVGGTALDDDALNRRTGDSRYLSQAAGGRATWQSAQTVSVVDGQITGVV